MRTSITNYMNALKRRKEETGESGFSLIELIVVVVILGVLAAIAIPVFMNIQGEAETNAVKTVAANGASQVAAQLAKGQTADVDNLNDANGITATVAAGTKSTTISIDNYCVTATKGTVTAKSGANCG
jgi:type IV pilus assembly protein PilA